MYLLPSTAVTRYTSSSTPARLISGSSLLAQLPWFSRLFGDAPGLNGQYTVVGTVASGMDVVDKLKKGSRALDGKVTEPDRIVTAR